MTPERYRKAGEIYHEALALTPDRRAEFLQRACGGDENLLHEVESLLAAHAEADGFIEGWREQSPGLMRQSAPDDMSDEPSLARTRSFFVTSPLELVDWDLLVRRQSPRFVA